LKANIWAPVTSDGDFTGKEPSYTTVTKRFVSDKTNLRTPYIFNILSP
jgi:hypothetical protein